MCTKVGSPKTIAIFYQNDEGDETGGVVDRTRTMIWDLTDLDEPEMIAEYFGDF